MKIALVVSSLLISSGAALAAFGIFQTSLTAANCGGGGSLVTAVTDCSNVLTTGGADPLTP